MTTQAITGSKPGLWETFLALLTKQPLIFLGLLGIQFTVVTLSYAAEVGFAKAVAIAFLFDILWLVIFIGIPALWALLLGLAILIIIGGLTFLIFQAFGAEGLLGLILALVAAIIIFSLVLLLLKIFIYCFPGFLAGVAIYELTDSTILAIIAFLVVTVITIIIIKLLFEYILPFLYGFAWAWVSLAISNQLAVSIVLGYSAWELMGRSYRTTADYLSLAGGLTDLIELIKAIFALPPALSVWVFLVGIFTGVLVVIHIHTEE